MRMVCIDNDLPCSLVCTVLVTAEWTPSEGPYSEFVFEVDPTPKGPLWGNKSELQHTIERMGMPNKLLFAFFQPACQCTHPEGPLGPYRGPAHKVARNTRHIQTLCQKFGWHVSKQNESVGIEYMMGYYGTYVDTSCNVDTSCHYLRHGYLPM